MKDLQLHIFSLAVRITKDIFLMYTHIHIHFLFNKSLCPSIDKNLFHLTSFLDHKYCPVRCYIVLGCLGADAQLVKLALITFSAVAP